MIFVEQLDNAVSLNRRAQLYGVYVLKDERLHGYSQVISEHGNWTPYLFCSCFHRHTSPS